MQELDEAAEFQLRDRPEAVSGQPKYEQLRSYVVSQIESGQFKAGTALPSEHRIAETLQVARSTVRQAMSALERDGLVRRVHGKGTYVADQARQRLRRGQDLFALIVPEVDTGFYPSLQKSFEESAAALHNQVIVCNSANEIDRQGNAILQLIDLHVAGVAIIPTTDPLTPAFHIRQLQQHGIPVVCCSRSVEGAQAPLLRLPFEEVGQRAGKLIAEHGHRNVGLIAGNRTEASIAYDRGFRAALAGKAEVTSCFGESPSTNVASHELEVDGFLDGMFKSPAPPTAIFVTFDSIAELVYVLLSRRGLRVPEDVSLVSFGGSRRHGALASRMTAVTLNERQLGHDAIELLNQMRLGQLAIDANESRDMPLSISAGQTLRRI